MTDRLIDEPSRRGTRGRGRILGGFGVREIRGRVPYSGRTDPSIGRDLLTTHGIEPTEAAGMALNNLAQLTGSTAGLILIDARGRVGFGRNTTHMPVCYITAGSDPRTAA